MWDEFARFSPRARNGRNTLRMIIWIYKKTFPSHTYLPNSGKFGTIWLWINVGKSRKCSKCSILYLQTTNPFYSRTYGFSLCKTGMAFPKYLIMEFWLSESSHKTGVESSCGIGEWIYSGPGLSTGVTQRELGQIPSHSQSSILFLTVRWNWCEKSLRGIKRAEWGCS